MTLMRAGIRGKRFGAKLAWLGTRLFGGAPRLSASQARSMRPKRSEHVLAEHGEGDALVLVAPFEVAAPLWARFLAKRDRSGTTAKRFELEPVGAFVWELCDGSHTFEAIGRKLARRFKMNRFEAEVALAAFLQTLGRKGLIHLEEASQGK